MYFDLAVQLMVKHLKKCSRCKIVLWRESRTADVLTRNHDFSSGNLRTTFEEIKFRIFLEYLFQPWPEFQTSLSSRGGMSEIKDILTNFTRIDRVRFHIWGRTFNKIK